MKKSTVVIALLAVLAIVFGILFITGNNEKNDLQAKVDELNAVVKSAADQGKIDLDTAVANAKEEAEAATTKAVEDAVAAAKAEGETALNDAVAAAKAEGDKALADAKAEGEKALADAKAAAEQAVADAKAEGEKALEAANKQIEELKTKAADLEAQIANAAAAAGEKVEEVKEAVEEKVEEAKDAASEAVGAATEAVGEKADEVKDAAAAVVEEAKETVEEAKETVEEKAEEVAAAVEEKVEEAAAEAAVMNYEAFKAAEIDSEVCVETYVQAIQKYNEDYGNTSVYAQSEDGAYFIYRLACTKEDAEKLVPGTKIKVKGFKGQWPENDGEIEIVDAKIEIVEGESFVAEIEDVTAKVGTDALIDSMNKYVAFKGMKVVGDISKKDDEKDPDIYFNAVTADGAEVAFCVEAALCGPDTEAYKAAAELKDGDVIDIEAYLYWYTGANPHVIKVAAAQ